MPSKLGRLIRQTRLKRGIGLREFARRIDKSPTFAVMLEKDKSPSVKEDTLREIAQVLELEADELLAAADKVPKQLRPRTQLDFALLRKVRKMSDEEKQKWIKRMSKEGW